MTLNEQQNTDYVRAYLYSLCVGGESGSLLVLRTAVVRAVCVRAVVTRRAATPLTAARCRRSTSTPSLPHCEPPATTTTVLTAGRNAVLQPHIMGAASGAPCVHIFILYF